jgi:two-component system LytT family response regulator
MSPIRTIIVDDERWARQRLLSLLRRSADFHVVAECANGESALKAIQAEAPDLIFLDVQIPRLNGLELIASIPREKVPLFVFVTAFDKYAVEAFDASAIDYLLKPFNEERFERALDRVRKATATNRWDVSTLQHVLASVLAPNRFLQRIGAKSNGRVIFVRVEEIDWIEATGNYLALHAGKETHLIRETLTRLEGKLDPRQFVRIHRSTIVNVERVRQLEPWSRGEQLLQLKDGTKLSLGRVFRPRLLDHLEGKRPQL